MKRRLLIVLIMLGLVSLALAQASGDYRTAQTGNWNQTSTWETFNGTSWIAAIATPASQMGLSLFLLDIESASQLLLR